MKTITLTLLLAFAGIYSHAQKVTFGKIDKADLERKECDYQKDAAAEYLVDAGEVNYFINSYAITYEFNVWVRLKIYSSSALDAANIKVPFSTIGNNSNVLKISGYTYNLSASGEVEVTELSKDAAYKQKISDTRSEVVFAMPNVKEGSVIEYKYTIQQENIIKFSDWYFQNDFPVRYSKYDISAPSVIDFTHRIYGNLKVEESSEGGTGGTKRRIFTATNIPSIRREPYMSSLADYEARVEFQIKGIRGNPQNSYTWKEITEMLLKHDYFGLLVNKTVLKELPELQAKVRSVSDRSEVIRTIYEYVQEKIKWDGYYSIEATKNIRQTINSSEGSLSDINLLLTSLLREAGIDAHPILISTRGHGKIKVEKPGIDQFNGVYVYAEEDGKLYVMNAANKYIPYDMIPGEVHLTNGLLIHKTKMQFVPLINLENRYNLTTVINAELSAKGNYEGTVKSYAGQYAKLERLRNYFKDSTQFKSKYIESVHKDYKFDGVEFVKPSGIHSDCEVTAKFKKALNEEAGYYICSVNLFTGMNENPFISEERFSDIEFGYNQTIVITGTITYDEQLVPEEIPKNLRMITEDSSIIVQRFFQKEESGLSFRVSVQINKPLYFTDEYPELKAMYKELVDILNESLVFRKKQ